MDCKETTPALNHLWFYSLIPNKLQADENEPFVIAHLNQTFRFSLISIYERVISWRFHFFLTFIWMNF